VHERCKTEVEFLVTKQWFIKYLDLKDKFIEAGKKIKWHPSHMRTRYNNWIKGLQWDWCISRQRYYGVPFPVWYCKKCGEVMLADDKDLPVDPLEDKPKKPCKCGSTEFEGEKDVLDTWATSSLTPQIPLKWREDEQFFKTMYPMTLRPQAHDIITFWAFNTVVKGLLHENKIPWTNIMISGHALDPHGKKMSKSIGNVIEPDYVIGKYSADCLRLWAAKSKLGEDLPSQEKDWQSAGKFIIKLWNASKFAISNLQDYNGKRGRLGIVDKWILTKLQSVINDTTESFKDYDYSKAEKEVRHFFWHDVCDDYLEICKHRLYNPEVYGEDSRRAVQFTLYNLLLDTLKILAPIAPHVTEELYHMYFAKMEEDASIHISSWPRVEESLIDKDAEEKGQIIVDTISHIRRYKAENGLPLNYELEDVKIYAKDEAAKLLEEEKDTLEGAIRLIEAEILTGEIKAEEHILEIVPDYSTIGPEFKGDAKRVVDFLKSCDKDQVVAELRTKGEVVIGDGQRLLSRHIKKVKREVISEGRKVDILEVPGRADISIVVAR
ncbi:MAG: class I tRNA ligase family protein, partial [Candidatus Hydrothermarchaeales archaeon]